MDEYDDFDPNDDGLPGMPLSVAMILAAVVTAPIWIPFAIICLGANHAVRLLTRRKHGG